LRCSEDREFRKLRKETASSSRSSTSEETTWGQGNSRNIHIINRRKRESPGINSTEEVQREGVVKLEGTLLAQRKRRICEPARKTKNSSRPGKNIVVIGPERLGTNVADPQDVERVVDHARP